MIGFGLARALGFKGRLFSTSNKANASTFYIRVYQNGWKK